jgi:HD superfamily phosphodiesterase
MIERVLRDMIIYFEKDVRRINHALKVYSFSRSIGLLQKISDRDFSVLEAAAVLHDIGIKESERKYNSASGEHQEIEGPPVAREILKKCGYEEDIIERICYLIGNHHTYNKIDGIDFQILVEADFLVNIYEDQIKKDAIETIRDKYFKTEAGIELLDSMY